MGTPKGKLTMISVRYPNGKRETLFLDLPLSKDGRVRMSHDRICELAGIKLNALIAIGG